MERFKKAKENKVLFTYTETGFDLSENNEVTNYDWLDIETIFGFKEDRFTSDEICLDIFFHDQTGFRLTESALVWNQFNSKLIKAIPNISENWEIDVLHPPFATNMKLLFDKNNRSKEEAEKVCYIN